MFPKEFESNFTLDSEDHDRFITQCDNISREILGEPLQNDGQVKRERRLSDGTFAKIARTAIRPTTEHLGYVINFVLFTPTSITEQDELLTTYEGDYFELTVDLISRETHRILGSADEDIDSFGDGEIDVDVLFETVQDYGDEDNDQEEESVLNAQFAPYLIDASDQLKILDIKSLLSES